MIEDDEASSGSLGDRRSIDLLRSSCGSVDAGSCRNKDPFLMISAAGSSLVTVVVPLGDMRRKEGDSPSLSFSPALRKGVGMGEAISLSWWEDVQS